MIKYFYYFLILLSSTYAKAQITETPVSIDWEFDAVSNKYYLESNSQYIHNDTLYIVLSGSKYKFKPSLKFTDFKYLEIEPSSLLDSVSTSKNSFAEIKWTRDRDNWVPIIKLSPVVEGTNTIELLSSFKLIESSVSNKNKAHSTEFSKTKNQLVFKTNSVLSSGDWIKLSVHKDGVYKIDNSMMGEIASKLGVSLSSIDPRNIAIYGQHGGMLPELNSDYIADDLEEISIEVIGESDGVFDNSDYILFYAEGPNYWGKVRGNDALHIKNIYDDSNYFFLTIKNTLGERVEEATEIIGDATNNYDYYSSRDFHEIDGHNFMESGQQWFGERFEKDPQQTISFSFPHRDITKDVFINTRVGAHPLTSSKLKVDANGYHLYDFSFSRTSDYRVYRKTSKQKLSSEDVNVNFDFTHGGQGECLLDYIEVLATSKLIFEDKQFQIFNPRVKSDGGISEYRISNTNLLRGVWNVTDPIKPKKINLYNNSGYKSFKEDSESLEYYQLLSDNDFYIPEVLETVNNQNLHSHNSVDYIIITNSDFSNSANKLADFHRTKGLSVRVIDVKDIYNEFSSGKQDLIAIRQYARMIYQRGVSSSRLKYLLMFGDASYDFKDRIKDNTNFVPAYQSYSSTSKSSSFVSDDYFGFMDDDEGDNITGNDMLDIAVGRIPIATDQEGLDVVNKIIGYNTVESLGDWRNKIQFIADDITSDVWEAQLLEDTEKLSTSLRSRNSVYNHQKVYLDAYKILKTSGGNTYPDAHLDFMQNVQNGNLVLNYFGHGSETHWTGEGLFSIDDVDKFQNNNNLPLFITVTCEFSRYDNPEKYTGGEKLLVYKNGGGIGLISTTREITVSFGSKINDAILSFLLPAKDGEIISIGEVLRRAKNRYPSYRSRRTVSLIGDPALFLAYPKKEIFVNQINYEDISTTDTIKSLMRVNISGEIRDNGIKDVNFNGEAFPLVFDKKVELESLDNNNFGKKLPYWEQKNVIYKGKSSVVDGEFVMEFVVPKDINYAYGNGKLSFYAISEDSNSAMDATGDNSDIIVGGIDVSSDVDDEGPKMDLFINNEYFVDGGITNSSPLLLVNLEDISGINTVGNGIGHDLKMKIVFDDTKEEIVLNEFYESEIDTHTRGKVRYQMLGLSPNSYTIEVVAWDVFNNSSTGYIHFDVVDDDIVKVSDIKNIPNPFTNSTSFSYEHNIPNEVITTRVEIFTISGMLVKTIIHHNNYNGYVVNDIVWDGSSDSGSLLSSGTYIYKISTISEEGKISNQEVNKLMIIR